MKIALLNEYTKPNTGGGCEAHMATLWAGLEELGHEVDIAGSPWHIVAQWADVVHVHNMVAYNMECLNYCDLKQKPYVISLHDYWPFCFPVRNSVWQDENCHAGEGCQRRCLMARPAWYEKICRATTITFCNRSRDIFARHGINPRVIEHGINLDFWHAAPRREITGPVRVGVACAWGRPPNKGIDIAERVEARLGNQAEFRYILGGQPRSAIRDLWHWSDVALVPSRYEETYCLTAAEAQACGRPVVAFRVGGLIDLASEAVPEGDEDALADAISRAGELPLVVIRSASDMAKDYDALYREIYNQAKAA